MKTMTLVQRPFSRRTKVSQYRNVSILNFIGAKDDEGVVTTGAIICAKLKSNCHQQRIITRLFPGQMPFLSPNQPRQNTEGRKHHISRTSSPLSHLGFSNHVFALSYNNDNNNNRISIAPYGRNFRGAGKREEPDQSLGRQLCYRYITHAFK